MNELLQEGERIRVVSDNQLVAFQLIKLTEELKKTNEKLARVNKNLSRILNKARNCAECGKCDGACQE